MPIDLPDDVSIRLERAVSLGFQSDLAALSDDASSMLEDFEQVVKDTQISFRLNLDFEALLENPEELASELVAQGYTGWFILCSHPVFKRTGHGHVFCSWGIYESRWFYGAEAIETALAAAIEWSRQDKANAKANPSARAAI